MFTLDDVKIITDYISNTFFRHFKLYQYTFANKPVLFLSHASKFHSTMKTPAIPPLSDAVLEIIANQRVGTTIQPSVQETDGQQASRPRIEEASGNTSETQNESSNDIPIVTTSNVEIVHDPSLQTQRKSKLPINY